MKILILSTLKRRVAPDVFASRSRIIYQLAEGLVKRGHEVSLLGTGDSAVPGVTVIPVIEKAWVDLPAVENPYLREIATLIQQAKKMVELQDSFDIIHNHTYPDFFPSIIENDLTVPLITTLHAVADSYIDDTLALYKKSHFVALSQAYQKLYTKNKPQYVVYNGINPDLFAFKEQKQDYLLWVGRLPKGKLKDGTFIDPKGVRAAIEVAKKTGRKLILTGPVEDPAFFEQDVKPHLGDKIQWMGEVSAEQTLAPAKLIELMQNAKAFLMTVSQEEPFGLVMAEAMSCGTPVIAFNRGSVSEVIVDGKTGYIVEPSAGTDGLAEAIKKAGAIHPRDCRLHVEQHFTIEKMVENYEKLYKELVTRS